MNEENKIELDERPHSRGVLPGPLEGRLVNFADSFEILEPGEMPDLRSYGRILRKRLPSIFVVFFILFTAVLIATLKQPQAAVCEYTVAIHQEQLDAGSASFYCRKFFHTRNDK